MESQCCFDLHFLLAKDIEHSYIYWPFVLVLLRIVCSVHLPIYLVGFWFFEGLVFWAPYIFWLLIPCQMYSWQRFSLILWVASSIWWSFLFLCRSLFISCSPLCQSYFLVAEPFEYMPCSLLHYIERFRPYIHLIHFELILAQNERLGSSFSFLQADTQQHLLKRLSFLRSMVLVPLPKIRWE
jgi:hypothetical protein